VRAAAASSAFNDAACNCAKSCFMLVHSRQVGGRLIEIVSLNESGSLCRSNEDICCRCHQARCFNQVEGGPVVADRGLACYTRIGGRIQYSSFNRGLRLHCEN
jgi:hypothetical protein